MHSDKPNKKSHIPKRKILKGVVIFISITFVLCAAFIGLYFYYGKPWHRALFMQPLHKLPATKKVIALTFDDGPSPTRTPALLALLDKHQVKATFFLVGQNIEKYPDITKEIVARGHVAANHSYSHQRMILKSPSFMTEEITKTNDLLKAAGSAHWQYFRPPNTKKLLFLPLVLKSLDMTLVTGSYDPNSQYQVPFPAEAVTQEVINNAEPGGIVFLHDGRDDSTEEFITAVEDIIIELKAQGYTFVTIEYKD
jgi:chitin deacetylase